MSHEGVEPSLLRASRETQKQQQPTCDLWFGESITDSTTQLGTLSVTTGTCPSLRIALN